MVNPRTLTTGKDVKLKTVGYTAIDQPQVLTFKLASNKRPRGLDVLLGHLLDKRISLRYKLTTIVAVQISLKI